jgi:hypothetical protein
VAIQIIEAESRISSDRGETCVTVAPFGFRLSGGRRTDFEEIQDAVAPAAPDL